MPKPSKEAIGRRIRQARERAGYRSQQELADSMDPPVSRNTVSGWERGAGLTLDNLERICTVINCDFEWLLHGDDRLVDRTVLRDNHAALQELLRRVTAIEEHLGI